MMTSASEHAAAPPVEPDLVHWKDFLRDQEEQCSRLGIKAAIVTIGLASPLDAAAVIEVLVEQLRPPDRAGILSDHEMSVLLAPIESIHHGQRLVNALARALRERGLKVHLGWAMRLDQHGLFHAAARADAAMLSSQPHGRPPIDLSDH